jgi:hypothetical protein
MIMLAWRELMRLISDSAAAALAPAVYNNKTSAVASACG